MVIVGGGFGGLYAARALARHPVRITLLDRQNYHLFQPLLYQVATAALSAGDIAKPIRSIVRRHTRMRVLLAEAQSVNLPERTLRLANGSALAYDYLVLATGASHTYFGHPEWEPFAPGLKTLEDALEIRRRVLLALEAAEQEEDASERRALLTFVIVGGGPTGVELAGAIAEITRHTVRYDFRAADPSQARVILLDAGPQILPSYPADLSARAEEQLWGLGVEVRKNAPVTLVTACGVHVGDEVITTRTALWAAGVRASPLGTQLGTPLDRSGRVLVEANLTVPGHPEVYVVGDLAAYTHHHQRNGDAQLPGVAPVAIQMGEHAAENIWRSVQGRPSTEFQYVDRGSMATIGRAAGIAQIRWVHLWGLSAWLAWLFVHIFFLIGFESRVLVLAQWTWSYFTYQRGARLITRTALSTHWGAQVEELAHQACQTVGTELSGTPARKD
ncbi:MAG: NAD(P)/FAD-dependent oxidoreductase [Chloroflexota bacterium]